MKRATVSKIFLLISVFSVLILSSCTDAIFSEVREEVKLSEAKVSGDIKSIIRYGNYIYVTNGDVYIKDPSFTTKTSWVKTTSPVGSPYDLAADSTYLYAVSILYVDTGLGYNLPTYRYLSCYKDGNWTTIATYSYYSSEEFVLFCTNTPQEAHRHAYLRKGSTVYELNGTEMTEVTTSTNATVSSTSVSCTCLGDEVIFSSSKGITSNETATTDATRIFTGLSSYIRYSDDGTNWSYVSIGCDTIISLAYTADYMMVGTEEGLVHTPWYSEGVPYPGTASYYTNADSALSSYYEVWAILAVSPEKSEYSTVAFASTDFSGSSSSTSASTSNIGLWGYYPTSYEWNRE